MNSRIKKLLSGTEVRFWPPRLLAFGLLALWFTGWLIADDQHFSPDLTVHEWGTFTAIAGKDGHAVQWTPLTGSTDLPRFVEHFNNVKLQAGVAWHDSHGDTGAVFLLSPRCDRVGKSSLLQETHHRVVSPCGSRPAGSCAIPV